MKISTLICIVLLCSAASAQAPKWTDARNWRLKLEPYMTTRQVRLLLGEPIDREVSTIAQIWYYEKGPTRQAGKVVKRPNRGIVRFERQKTIPRTNRTPAPAPTFVVVSFTEPDWPNIPPDAFKSKQQLAREQQAQATLEKRKAAEEQRLRTMKEKEALAKERQEQLETARQEQRALFEERRRQLQARMQANETPAEEPENLLSKYLYAVGTITLAIAAAVFLKKRYL